jgi:hypothetical protein
VSRIAVLPVASPNSTAAVANIIASDDDSWLLPCAKPAWPLAQECPAYGSKCRRNGNLVSPRAQFAESLTSSSTMPPYRLPLTQPGS